MPVQTLLWIVLLAVAASIAISYFCKVNLGIPALVFAYIIGVFVQGMKVKEVVAQWPTSVVFQLMTITMFFSFAIFNGTLPKVADNIIYKFRNNAKVIPFALLLIGTVIGALGAPPPACATILAVLTFTIAVPAGLSPWLCAVIVCFGGSIGTFFPWAVQGSVIKSRGDDMLEGTSFAGMGEFTAYKACLHWILFTLILFLIFFFITKAYKIGKVDVKKPEPFTDIQKKNLIIIIVVAALVIVPNLLKLFIKGNATLNKLASALDIQMLAIIGTLICTLMKLGSERDAIVKGIPWNTIMMVGGVCTMMGVASAAGVTQYIGDQLAASSFSTAAIVAILALIGAFLSLFSGAINAVFPMLGAIAVPYATAAGISPIPLLVAIVVGASATAISPFSTGGAIMIANVPDQKVADGLFLKTIVLAICGAALAALMAVTGIFNI